MAAGTTVARINTIVTANTKQYTLGMAKAQLQSKKFGKAALTAARAASGPLTLGMLAVGGAAIKAATDFDDSMTKIESLVGIAGAEVDAMKDSVKALSGQTAQAPAKLADAMFFIQSAGLRGATAMETLEASAKAASVGLGDVTEIADLATSALNAYGEENISAVKATDVLTAAVREGKLEASELAGSMGRVLPIASAMGVRFDEVGAAFAALSRTGTNAAEAATQVRGILSSLLRPTKQAEEALTGMGLSSEGLRQQIKDEGLLATLQTLAEEFDGNAAASASVFGNVRALSGVMDLMGANVATTEQIFASMKDTTGTIDDAFSVVSDTAGFKFRQAIADVQEALVTIGQKVLPIVLTMLEGARSMVDAFKALPTPIKLTAAALAALVVASGPIGQIALAVGGLLFAFGKMGEESRKAADRQSDLTDEFIAANDPASMMISQMQEMADAIEDVGDASDDATNPVGEFVGSNLALSMALEDDLLPLFDKIEISMDDVAKAAENGSDEFQNMENRFHTTENAGTALRKNFDQLTESELLVAEAAVKAREEERITAAEFDKLMNVVDETADAFDDHRKAVEQDAEAFMKSTDAAKLLNDANLDAEKILSDLTTSGKTYTEQAEDIFDIVTANAAAMEAATIESEMARFSTEDLAAATAAFGAKAEQAEAPVGKLRSAVGDVREAMALSAAEAKTLQQAFEELMGSVIFEGEALNNTQLLMADFDEILANLAGKSVPELRDSFFDMATTAAGQLGELLDAGVELGSPEMIGAADSFIADIDAMGAAAKLPLDQINEIKRTLLEMSGQTIPVTIMYKQSGSTFSPEMHQQNARFRGATGGIVRRPTMALIGEAGPEAVVPLNQAPGASPLPSGGGMGGAVNVTVNMPPGSDGADVVRSLQQYARSHGGVVPILTGQL